MIKTRLLLPTIFTVLIFSQINAQQERWVAPENAKEIANIVPAKKRATAAKKGEKIFKSRCVFCHGAGAKGDGAAGSRLNPKPADLTSERVQNQEDGEIFGKYPTGGGLCPDGKWSFLKKKDGTL